MERSKPITSDILILSGLTNAPAANPDSMLSELCGRMGELVDEYAGFT